MKPYNVLRLGEDLPTGVVDTLSLYAYTSLIDYAGTTNQATASISLNSDGTITLYAFGDGSVWHNVPASGLGSSYWALITLTSGSVTSGTVGSRVSLATGATWSVTTTGSGELRTKNILGTIEIWDAAVAGTMVGTGSFRIEATMQANISQDGGGGGGGGGDDHYIGQPIVKA